MKSLITLLIPGVLFYSFTVRADDLPSISVNDKTYSASTLDSGSPLVKQEIFKSSSDTIVSDIQFGRNLLFVQKSKNASDYVFCKNMYGCATVNEKMCEKLQGLAKSLSSQDKMKCMAYERDFTDIIKTETAVNTTRAQMPNLRRFADSFYKTNTSIPAAYAYDDNGRSFNDPSEGKTSLYLMNIEEFCARMAEFEGKIAGASSDGTSQGTKGRKVSSPTSN